MKTEIVEIGAEQVAKTFADIGNQFPFALATTLNGLANSSQQITKDDVREHFTLRRPDFVLNTIYRKRGEDFATKQNLQAAVRINDERDFLAKFETGGEKSGTDGHRIAIPIDVRRNKNEVVTSANRPRALLQKPRVALVRNVILQKVGRTRAAASRLLYLLKPTVKIPDLLNMREDAEVAVNRDFDKIANAAIDTALRTAR